MQAEKKPLYTSLAAAVLVLIVGFAVLSHWQERGTTVTNTPSPTSSSTASGNLRMEVVTLASSTPLYTIHAEYPHFADAPQLDKQMDAYVADAVSTFVENVTSNDKARKDTAPAGETPTPVTYTLDISWEHAQLNATYASFIMHLYAYDGGANGRQELRSFNWDMRTQREVPLSALFPNDASYLSRISEYTRQVLSSQLGDNTSPEFLNDGTQPISTSFQWYTFTDDAVTIWFPKYQVAPGVAGEQKVVIPRNVPGLF